MSTNQSKLEQAIIDTICELDARLLATSLDNALSLMVQSNLQFPSETFEDDYYSVEKLRTAIRNFADHPDTKTSKKASINTSSKFDSEPLEKVLLTEYNPDQIEGHFDNAMNMLLAVKGGVFSKIQIFDTYSALRQLRDAIRKGGKVCQ